MFEVLMRPSAEFLPGLASGALLRYGAILKDAATGEVVGHLKEVGNIGLSYSGIVSSPITSAITTVSSLAANVQLHQLQKAVDALKLISSAGAAASVASLGVSVVGFAAVLSQLKRLSAKLDSSIELSSEIKDALGQQGLKWDVAAISDLETASNATDKALAATSKIRRRELLREAAEVFSQKRNYFGVLLSTTQPFSNHKMSLSEARALLARFQTAALGEIHAEFLMGDFGACRTAIDFSKRQLQNIAELSAKEIFVARAGRSSHLGLNPKLDELKAECIDAATSNSEAYAQAATAHFEVDFVEQAGLDPVEHLQTLRGAKPDLVLIRHPQISRASI